MSLLPFLLVTGVGAIAALLLRGRERVATAVGIVGLLAAVVAALAIRPGQSIVIDEGGFATTDYLRLFLVLGALVALLLAIVGEATGNQRDAPTVALGILASSALALSLPDPRVAVLAGDGRWRVRRARRPRAARRRLGATVGTRVLRATAIAGTMAIAATAWIGRDLSRAGRAADRVRPGVSRVRPGRGDPVRGDPVPCLGGPADRRRPRDVAATGHRPRAGRVLAIVALAWADASVAPLALDLSSVRFVVLAVAIASILPRVARGLDPGRHRACRRLRDRRRRRRRDAGDRGARPRLVGTGPDLDPRPRRDPQRVRRVGRRDTGHVRDRPHRRAARLGRPRADPRRGAGARRAGEHRSARSGRGRGPRCSSSSSCSTGPFALVAVLGTLSPLLYYGRLFAIGIERPGTRPRMPWRPVVAGST